MGNHVNSKVGRKRAELMKLASAYAKAEVRLEEAEKLNREGKPHKSIKKMREVRAKAYTNLFDLVEKIGHVRD